KATVQAAIGSAPLMAMRAAGMETGPGEVILAVAVLSIVLTAPTGAWAITALGDRVLAIAPESVYESYDAAIESAPEDEVL
ncbi:MAG: sodium:proton antiporter, partial [Phycisphaerae bacterium]